MAIDSRLLDIKTFPARTMVFVDGEFRPELSDDSDSNLPMHIIYVGEINGDIRITNHESPIMYFSLKTKNKKPAFLNIFIENTGKNSEINGDIVVMNFSDLKIDIKTDHLAGKSGIKVHTRVLAHACTSTELTVTANIVADAPDCNSDISFSVMAAPDAKIKMSPAQRIASVPESAEHSAGLYRGTKPQIEYLSVAGLNDSQIQQILEDAFLN